MKVEITNSSRTCFLDCPRKYFFDYICRLTPKVEPEYFIWGELVHRALQIWHECFDVEKSLEQVTEWFGQQPNATQHARFLKTLELLLTAYALKYLKTDSRFELIVPECEFQFELPHGIFRGKPDLLLRDKTTGEIVLKEIKTASQTGPHWWTAYEFDAQTRGYCLAAREGIGYDVSYVIVDVLKKPQLQRRKYDTEMTHAERIGEAYLLNPEKYFERRTLRYTDETLTEYYHELDGVCQCILWHMETGIWPRHHPRNRFGHCPFEMICLEGEQSPKAALYYYVRPREQLFKELSDGIDATTNTD